MGSGKVSAMLSQWSSVKKSLQEEEEEQTRRELESQDPEVSVLASNMLRSRPACVRAC